MTNAAPKTFKDGNLGITLATWVYMLHASGRPAAADGVRQACEAIENAPEGADTDALGQALVGALRLALGDGVPSFAQVHGALVSWYGAENIATDMGASDSREERARLARRYQFGRNLPWIARIIDRFPDGTVGVHWVMVEEVTSHVRVMDPYPWDDVDEEYEVPLNDFMVKWELAGVESLRFA